MQEQAAEGIRIVKAKLIEAERERDRANMRLTEAMSTGKVTDMFTELNSVRESLSRSNQELKNKEKTIASLKVELEKAREFEPKLIEKDASLERLKEELSNVKSSSQKRIQELEAGVEKERESEKKLLDSFATQTRQLEQTKILLEESKLEITSLRKMVDKSESSSLDEEKVSMSREIESLKSELQEARENLARAQDGEKQSSSKTKNLMEEMDKLRNEMKLANEAEENSKKAMDDLALALKEVAAEAKEAKEKLILTQEELESVKKEAEELKEKSRSIEEKHKAVLDEARKEADRFRNTAERLRLEAEESILAWNEKETGFVDCIRKVEEEKTALMEDNSKLLELVTDAENLSKTAKEENLKLRDILKQALNEANVAKEAAGIAREENSLLKDVLAEKDDALMFITRENENLRINEASSLENIEELKRLLSEGSGKEIKAEEKDHEQRSKAQNSSEREQKDGKKLSNAFSFNLKDLITYKHNKDITVDEEQRSGDKHNENGEVEDYENVDPLKGSIFDVAESPVAPPASHHRRRSSLSFFTDVVEAVNSEDYEHLEGHHIDDLDIEKNGRKKKALLRRFGDIIIRRRKPSFGGESHKKEASNGGESHKKEASNGGEVHKKDGSVGSEGHKKEEAHKKETAAGE